MFKAYGEVIAGEAYICPSTLTDDQLKQGHSELMECPFNTYYWRELDEELAHRCEEEEMEWPY